MQPATQRIVDEATRFILDGVTKENMIARDETNSLTAINVLDKQAQSLRYTLKALYTSLTLRIAETERSRNGYTSIHRLPLELLINIFKFVLEDGPVSEHFKRMAKLVCVSHNWNNILQQTPSVWAYIDSSVPLPVTMNALAKSLRTPLNVSLSAGDLYRPSRQILMEALKHVPRWGHVKLTVEHREPMLTALEVPAPLLTHIDISSPHPTLPIDLFRGKADRLQHLQLTGVSIPFHTSMLSGLNHLELRELYYGPSTSSLLRVLIASPNLSHLTLVGVRTSCDRLPEDRSPIVMPDLTFIELRQLTPGYCATLLRAIRAPECASLHLQCDMLEWRTLAETDHPSTIPFLQDTVGHLVEPVRRILRQCDDVSIHLTASTLRFRHGPPTAFGPLELDLTSVSPVDALRWIVETFSPELARTPTSMTLGPDFPVSDPTFLATLRHLERMNAIDIQGVDPTTDLNPFLDHLQYPFTCYDSDVKRWALPCLRRLTISSDREWSSFLPMIRSRYGMDDTIVIEGMTIQLHSELPLPFEKLELPALYRNPDLMHQIIAIAGEGVLERHTYMYPRFGGPAVWYGGAVIGGGGVFVEDADGAPMAYPGNIGPIPLPLGHPAIAAHSLSLAHTW